MHTGKDYWKNYMDNWFGSTLINQWEKNCKEETIFSNNESLHIEMYISGNKRPTLVFSHGIAGYARVLLPFVLPLYKKGINIICPDLKGYGYNTHRKGDFTWNHHVSNLIDTVKYARKKFDGPIFLGGASMGGPLAYEAATQIDDIAGIICWCLWDLSDREYVENETSMKKATFKILPFLKFLNFFLGRIRIKTYSIVTYDTLTAVPKFNDMIKNDPQAGTLITLRGALSLILQSKPTLPYEKWIKPTIIFQPGSDRMTPLKYIKNVFDGIGSKDKKYIQLDGSAHFPVEKKYYEKWSEEAYDFICLVTSSNSV